MKSFCFIHIWGWVKRFPEWQRKQKRTNNLFSRRIPVKNPTHLTRSLRLLDLFLEVPLLVNRICQHKGVTTFDDGFWVSTLTKATTPQQQSKGSIELSKGYIVSQRLTYNCTTLGAYSRIYSAHLSRRITDKIYQFKAYSTQAFYVRSW